MSAIQTHDDDNSKVPECGAFLYHLNRKCVCTFILHEPNQPLPYLVGDFNGFGGSDWFAPNEFREPTEDELVARAEHHERIALQHSKFADQLQGAASKLRAARLLDEAALAATKA